MCEFFVSSMCELATPDKFAEKKTLKKSHGGLDGGQKFATTDKFAEKRIDEKPRGPRWGPKVRNRRGRGRAIKAYNAARTPSASAVWGETIKSNKQRINNNEQTIKNNTKQTHNKNNKKQ